MTWKKKWRQTTTTNIIESIKLLILLIFTFYFDNTLPFFIAFIY